MFGGWYLTPQEIYTGFSRLMYPFICGLLISRVLKDRSSESNPSGSPIRIKYGFPLTAMILIAILGAPCIGGTSGLPNGIFQATAILIIFPLVVIVGAGSTMRTNAGTKICKWLGELSYPLYITHYPLLYLQMSFAIDHPEAPVWMHFMVAAGVVVIDIFLARCLYKVYDLPVRKWLTEHWVYRK